MATSSNVRLLTCNGETFQDYSNYNHALRMLMLTYQSFIVMHVHHFDASVIIDLGTVNASLSPTQKVELHKKVMLN